MKFLHLIWSNLKRKKLRTALTLVSILVAFMLFGFLSAVKQALVGGVELAGQDRLIVRHKVSIIQPLPISYKSRIERIPGVAKVTHMSWFGGRIKDSKQFFPQMPVVPSELLDMYPEFLLPRDQFQAWQRTRTGAIVGRKSAEAFHWKIGDRVSVFSPIWRKSDGSGDWEFEIMGIFDGAKKGTDTTQLFFHYDYFDEARQFGQGLVGWYIIRVSNPANAAQVAKQVDAEFANSSAETNTDTEAAFTQAFAKQIGNIALIVGSILGAVFFTILLVTGNTMSQSVRERTGELGVLKALGFTNGQMLMLVLGESCLLSLLGGVIGLGLALILTSGDPTGGRLPLFFLPPRDLLVGLLICLLLGLATGVFPALQAMRLRAADSLRRM